LRPPDFWGTCDEQHNWNGVMGNVEPLGLERFSAQID
jgi:hypothetical protein